MKPERPSLPTEDEGSVFGLLIGTPLLGAVAAVLGFQVGGVLGTLLALPLMLMYTYHQSSALLSRGEQKGAHPFWAFSLAPTITAGWAMAGFALLNTIFHYPRGGC